MSLRWSICLTGIALCFAVLVFQTEQAAQFNHAIPTFTNRILVKGSTGIDVRELQGRLKLLGFYKANVDGIFGWRTYWAVRNFQDRFGMPVDGKAGVRTIDMLKRATPNYNPWQQSGNTAGRNNAARGNRAAESQRSGSTILASSRFSRGDLQLMAQTVYGEARGEPYIGQVAIAAVILNRLQHPQFPHTIPGIIFQPGAFTAVSDGQIWLTPNETARRAVRDALNGWDPSGGATYYFNPETATSKWIWSRPQIKKIGKHIFCL
ncbi:spore cortex-lytic enzyme [Effusibacillus dendaii]|uniref:Spore cortex-lytic enzyme n=1 Tax=Effusibacillus dendaii TaxID=2743772 RepID=A0A7I8D5F4_9BACL|nr:spore cortex-lytic enzyme [Effusibacillus dendaii]BCJ85358.1 spore cortex-lytic enzyme [Effusibacillus dendaii]